MPFVSPLEAQLTPLWTDAPDAVAQLDQRVASAAVKANERAHYIDHGWLVMPKAIAETLIDAFVADLSDDWPDACENPIDLYANFESSRAVCLHPKISRFLDLIFDTKPLAFQQLLFQHSNGHGVHQDTSVVAVEQPVSLAASWIALQDVHQRSGERAFYDRSHKSPTYLFKDGRKRFRHDRADLPNERFLAKKGDVFLWAADPVHRSHPRAMPDDTPRMSCVTHYCPTTTEPFWFRFHPENRAMRPYRSPGSLASSYYQLPERRGHMIRPNALS
jgi:hypothetical protein